MRSETLDWELPSLTGLNLTTRLISKKWKKKFSFSWVKVECYSIQRCLWWFSETSPSTISISSCTSSTKSPARSLQLGTPTSSICPRLLTYWSKSTPRWEEIYTISSSLKRWTRWKPCWSVLTCATLEAAPLWALPPRPIKKCPSTIQTLSSKRKDKR